MLQLTKKVTEKISSGNSFESWERTAVTLNNKVILFSTWTHLTFIFHGLFLSPPPPWSDWGREGGLMYHCHLDPTTWLRVMHNYDKWLMMALWSLNIVCIHICLITATTELRFQTASCSLWGQESCFTRAGGLYVHMNKYVVWSSAYRNI